MTQIRERSVLFADLRGSTALFETLGNAEASGLVTQTVALIGQAVDENRGDIIKTLGDGLMAAFDNPRDGIKAAMRMQELLVKTSARSERLRHTHLQIALARGEVV
ncbi:adenylate/guanylate cyclase domain-containing protein, partial [Mitsuaria sp. TWR114]